MIVRKHLFPVSASLIVAGCLCLMARVPLAQFRTNIFAFGDLRAFYCAARIARAGGDPYVAGPIGMCERATVAMHGSNFLIPAPIPGHAIALFELLAGFGFPTVAVFWCGLLAVTFFVLVFATMQVTGWPYIATSAALVPLAFMIPIDQGQLVSVAVLLLVLATVALTNGQDGISALLAAAATIEPHIGLPACIALFIDRPRSRLGLVIAALALALTAARTIGPAALLEYVRRVLPEHIASEARYDDQYSLTYLLCSLHVPVGPAIALGQCSYWLMAAAGVAAAIRLRSRLADARWLLLVPMALSVVGGPYVHREHLLAAVPLAVLLVATADARTRGRALLTLVLIAWPAKFVLEIFDAPGGTMNLGTASSPEPTGAFPVLADAAWATRIAADAGHLPFLLAKIPTWIGFALLAWAILDRLRTGAPAIPDALPERRATNAPSGAPQRDAAGRA